MVQFRSTYIHTNIHTEPVCYPMEKDAVYQVEVCMYMNMHVHNPMTPRCASPSKTPIYTHAHTALHHRDIHHRLHRAHLHRPRGAPRVSKRAAFLPCMCLLYMWLPCLQQRSTG